MSLWNIWALRCSMQQWYVNIFICDQYSSSMSINCVMILTADSDGLFFSQTRFTSNVTVLGEAKTPPFASIKLVVDKNLIELPSIRYYYYFYYISHTSLISIRNTMTNARVDVNGQPIKHYRNYIFNFTNATECSNGARTFLSVPVNIYINATGMIYFSLEAVLHNQSTGYRFAHSSGTARINNGIKFCNFITITC